MPTNSLPCAFFVGKRPPANPSATTRWRSQSMKHMRVPNGAAARRAILGSAAGQSAAQEMNVWWNAALGRCEALYNINNRQFFTYAASPYGPWAPIVNVLGQGAGGEAGNVSQCHVHVEGNMLYALYPRGISDPVVHLASAPMPTTPGAVPVWAVIGDIWTDTTGVGSPFIIKANGSYWMFLERGSSFRLLSSSATSLEQLSSKPFALVSNRMQLRVPVGVRANNGWGRPQVSYEDGTWVLTAHATATLDFGYQWIQRWTCTEASPINWIPDPDGKFLREESPLEIDQVADFRAVTLGNDVTWAFWTASDNPTPAFSIMCAPMEEPTMAHDGGDWVPVTRSTDQTADFPYINPDVVNGATQTVANRWDVGFDTSTTACLATLPRATSHANVKFANTPTTLPGFHVTMKPIVTTDRIMGPVAIASVATSGTTVTVTTVTPHGMSSGDYATVTGFTPTAYNVNGAAVTIIDASTFSYVASSAPAAMTVLGCYDRSLRPGEERKYRCRQKAGTFYRD